jgi:hypothetical protein
MRRCAVVVAAVVVLLLIVLVVFPARRRNDSWMAGMWVGDPGFLSSAGLSDMQLFISPRCSEKTRRGYVIIADSAGEFLVNEPTEVDYSFSAGSAFRPLCRKCKGEIRITIENETGAEKTIPPVLKLELDSKAGTLTLYDDEKMFALLYKDLLASHTSELMWIQGMEQS